MSINQNRGDNKIMDNKPDDMSWWARLIKSIAEKSSFTTVHRSSKYYDTKRMQRCESYLRKLAAKKKRLRHISYQSRRVNRMRAK